MKTRIKRQCLAPEEPPFDVNNGSIYQNRKHPVLCDLTTSLTTCYLTILLRIPMG